MDTKKEKSKEVKGFFKEYFFLSNFYKCEVPYKGLVFPSSEHAFMYAKLKDNADPDKAHYEKIIKMEPNEVKRWGRRVNLRIDWNRIRIQVMSEIVESKFRHNPALAAQLMRLEDYYIEETNNWNDTFWGVCNGVGKNHLGNILMTVRDILINENVTAFLFYDSFVESVPPEDTL